MMLKKALAVILSLACVMGLSACSTAETDASGGGASATSTANNPFPGSPDADTVVIDMTSDAVDLNPLMLQDSISMTVLTHCMAGLTRLDENDQPVADIAESWDISDDGLTYTMHLREDATWSNGDPVTANDFYFSWMTQMDPATGSPLADLLYTNIKNGEAYYSGTAKAEEVGVEVLDDYTLRVAWERPISTALFLMGMPVYFPVQQAAYERIGADQYAQDPQKMLTNGPYELTEWVHEDHMSLVKSETYFGADSIRIPKLKLVMIGDSNTRLNAFLGGELDMANLFSDQIEQVSSQSTDAVDSYIDGGAWYFDFNTKNRYLSNADLRRALAYGVDIQSLLDNVIQDGSLAAAGFVPDDIAGANGTSYADARGSLFSYDPDAARSYLEKALSTLGITADELKLSLTVNDTSYSQTQAAYVQQQWKQTLGLDIEINVLTAKAQSEAKRNGDYDLSITGWGPSENDAMTYLEVFTTGNPNNFGSYSNAEYDRLIAAADEELDATKRQGEMIEAEKILIGDMGIGPMYDTCTTYAVSSKVEGLARTPFQLFNVYSKGRIVSAG